MRRTNIYLTDEEHAALRERARSRGVSMAEVVRDIVDRDLGLAPVEVTLEQAVAMSASVWSSRSDEEIDELRRLRSGDRFARFAD